MKHTIEIERRRISVTQGYVDVKFDGEVIVTYADEIKLVGSDDFFCGARGRPTYGENMRGWASIHSDEEYLLGLFKQKDSWGQASIATRISLVLENRKKAKKEVAA